MTYTWKDGFLLKLLNLALCFGLLAWNIHTIKTHGSADYFHASQRETYFTPANWVFSIWIVIYGLLCGTSLYQFTPRGTEVILDGIPWGIPLIAIFNAAYLYLRAHEYYIAAIFANFVVYLTIGTVYYNIKKRYQAHSWLEQLFIHLPFSLLYGWTTYVCYLALFEAFGVDALTERAGVWTKIFVFFSLSWLQTATGTSASANDFHTAAVIAWSLWAVHVHQTSSGFVNTASLVFFAMALFSIVGTILFIIAAHFISRRPREDEERSPLIPGRR